MDDIYKHKQWLWMIYREGVKIKIMIKVRLKISIMFSARLRVMNVSSAKSCQCGYCSTINGCQQNIHDGIRTSNSFFININNDYGWNTEKGLRLKLGLE